jgi:hypothetical protein
LLKHYPERIDFIRSKEIEFGYTFFPPGIIPERFCTKEVTTQNGEKKLVPAIDDVVNYFKKNPNQFLLFDSTSKCESTYNLCDIGADDGDKR